MNKLNATYVVLNLLCLFIQKKTFKIDIFNQLPIASCVEIQGFHFRFPDRGTGSRKGGINHLHTVPPPQMKTLYLNTCNTIGWNGLIRAYLMNTFNQPLKSAIDTHLIVC